MPQIIPLVVTAITAVTSAVVAAGPLAVAAFNAANVLGAAALANEAFKAVQPQVKSSSTALEWTADPNAPNRFAFGRVGGAGNIIHNASYGPDNMYVGFVGVMSASGPINRWVGFRAEETPVTFDGSGKANSSYYANVMWLDRLNGTQPATRALSSPSGLKNGASMPSWGASAKLSGKAAYMYTLGENSKRSAYEGKVPTGIHTIEGLLCYDPRRDSTYPGGSGSCRLNDPSTWVYSTNAYIHGLNWAIGRWEGLTSGTAGAPYASMKVGGIGARPEAIDFAAYVEGANVFDENAWACAAWPDADQGKAAVLDSFLQAGGGIYAERQGRISCMHRAAPRTSVATIRTEDTAGTIEYDTTTSLLDRINTIRPEYWSENHNWQMVATDEVTSSVWRLEDGQGVALTKSKGMQYNYVPGSKQARELACLQIAHTREGIRGTAPLRHYLDLEVGDCIDFEVPEAVLNGQKVIILNVDPDLENDIINVTFASESDPKYPFAFGQTAAPPPAPSIVPGDPTIVSGPLPGDWTVVVRPPSDGGGQVPGFDLTGLVSNAMAFRVLVEYGPTNTSSGPWTVAYDGPPTTERLSITVPANDVYYVAISYLNRAGNVSQRTVYGPYTAPGLTADDVIIPGGRRISEQFPPTVDLPTLTADARRAASTLIRETMERWNRTKDEKIASIEREDVIKGDLVETRETLTLAVDGALSLIESVETASISRDAAETATRQTQISVMNGNVAALELTTGTLATNLSAETYQRMIAVSAVADSVASAQSSISTLATALSAETSTRATQYAATQDALAVYDSRITTATSQGSANATAITNLGVSLAGVSGIITTVQSAQVALNGKVNLLYGFALNAGGRVAGMYAANDGSTSVIDFEFDVFRIWSGSASVPMFAVDSGNVYIAGNRVNTASLVSNAVTNGASSRTTGDIGVFLADTEVQSVAMTTAGGRVRVDFSVNLFSIASAPTDVIGTVRRNGSVVWTGRLGRMDGEQRLYVQAGTGPMDIWVDIPMRLSSTATGFFIDTDPAGVPAAFTYSLAITSASSVTVSERNMALLEIKR